MKRYILFFLIIPFIISACSSSDSYDGRKTLVQILTIEQDSKFLHIQFGYNGENIQSVSYTGDGQPTMYTFTRGGNKLYMKEQYKGNTYNSTFELTKGLATKAVYNQGTEDEYEVNYNYNMNNQLYEIIKLNAYKYNLTWVDDDVRNIQIQDENGLRVNNCTYTDHIINTNIDMNMFLAGFSVGSYFPNSYFGKKTKHLLKSTDVYTYEYEFDDWDNLTVVTETSKANGKKTIYTIYYDSTIYQ